MVNLGFKKLMASNWLEPDKISSSFVSISSLDKKVHPITGDVWRQKILKVDLVETVPIEIQRLFEVTRGALVYGYFFYPLFALAGQQLFRVAEAAVTSKCRTMEAPKFVNTFQKKVEWLIHNGVISKHERDKWDGIRKLRNIASHPEDQSIFLPGAVIGILERIADDINSLFGNT